MSSSLRSSRLVPPGVEPPLQEPKQGWWDLGILASCVQVVSPLHSWGQDGKGDLLLLDCTHQALVLVTGNWGQGKRKFCFSQEESPPAQSCGQKCPHVFGQTSLEWSLHLTELGRWGKAEVLVPIPHLLVNFCSCSWIDISTFALCPLGPFPQAFTF